MSAQRGYVDVPFLEATGQMLSREKRRSYELMQVARGHRVLDVGCGPGTDTIPLAHLVGPGGEVVGVDADAAMVAEADARARAAGVGAWVVHTHADVGSLPLDSDSFDSCRSERVFQHLSDPARVLVEMVRVTRRGGWIVIGDPDWGTLSIDTSEVNAERAIGRVQAERLLVNGYSGRSLFRLFRRLQLADIQVLLVPMYFTSYPVAREMLRLDEKEREAVRAAVIPADELSRWHADLREREAAGCFFGSVTGVVVAGRKA